MTDTWSTGTPNGTPGTDTGARLDSWKEIAAYLKRDVATVRRWEKRELLPVHRHQHEKQGSVYAFTNELDAWATGRRQAGPLRQPNGWRDRLRGRGFVIVTASTILAVAAGLIWAGSRSATDADVRVRSIAVLPFQSLDPDTRDRTLEFGMADALITRLAGLPEIEVRPMSAVLQYADGAADLSVISRRLRVDALVEGKVQRHGGRIRVSVHVIRVGDAAPLLRRDLEEPFTDVFAVQDSIADAIARALSLRLRNDAATRVARRETGNVQANQAYVLGRYFRNQVTEDGLRKAVEQFRQAVALDPEYALAHAALADAYALFSNFAITPSRDAYLNAKAAALEALRLDDTLADAHTTLAMVNLFHDWDRSAAEREFTRALALDPNDARAHQRYGLALMWFGEFDAARREIERARELDPVALEINGNLSLVSYYARQYDRAIVEARRTLDMDPHAYQAHRTIGRALVEQGKASDAVAIFQQAIDSGGIRSLTAELGHALAVSGRTREARRILGTLAAAVARREASPFDLAVLYTGLGEPGQAFVWLERSYADRERWMVTLKVAPALDPLRGDPRFADLIRRVGLWPD